MTSDQHVVPVNDLRDHVTDGLLCWCKPRRSEDDEAVIIHNAMDQREAYERGKRKPS